LRSSRFARPSAVFLHKHPDVDVHLQIGNGLHHTGLESGLWRRGSKQTADDLFRTGRYEADPHLVEVAEAAVEAVLDRTAIHVPDGVLEALDPAPDGWDGDGLMAGSWRLRMPCPTFFERRCVPMVECVEVSQGRGAVADAQFPVRAVHFRREALGRHISDDHRGISEGLRAAGSRIIDDLGSPRGMGRAERGGRRRERPFHRQGGRTRPRRP